MALTKDRFVTACQQVLAAGAVSALALTAGGVATLDIVGPGGHHGSNPDAAGVASLLGGSEVAPRAVAAAAARVVEHGVTGLRLG